jgi:NADP-dependent 3-hydroxy acid dehydrogenase YdfG
VLGSNNDDYKEVYNVNFLPNWEIVKHYMSLNVTKNVKIIFIGSTSFKKGKGNYILYSSSKAALHNLYQGAREKFKNTNIRFTIFHPQRFKSKLINKLNNKGKFQSINVVVNDLIKKIL